MVGIKDFGMPSCCRVCELNVKNMYCQKTNSKLEDMEYRRNSDCPLVEIEERKVGKWIKKSQYGHNYCSECDYEHCGYGYPKYCPNCGAKMDKE